ncbi:MAG: glutamine synthetase type III [Ruminococcaceae bacterium]|nr:glutamine synthetase type III [Oscillospiraceae bacterium]
MGKLTENFGEMVFNDRAMREKLPSDIYKSLKKTILDGKDLDITVANVVANAMKVWAIEKGATHYTHWFQPLTGITAEKHDSFLQPAGDGTAIEKFSGKNLIKGEPDASSFPSGGLRATFEARGYTAWDPTSYAFIKDDTLCIPTAFCSYGGEMLDKKTPLLRSTEILSDQAVRVLHALGRTEVKRVVPNTGAEQEYFILDKEDYLSRRDLVFTGRTLFGAPAPKGQELDDHYFGVIKPRVKAFMAELDRELWKLGIFAATEHNEAAPSQHELAPVYSVTNLAADHNQLTMEIMKKVADRQGLVCLFHEKPFAGVNGSGKHNNWSIATGLGENLLNPGSNPHENTQFLLFLSAVITAVDEYQDLLRVMVASASNDHRLGAGEAPPAIISIYLGDELTAILDCVESGKKYSPAKLANMQTGVHVLPDFQKDTTDRNRTSPFAFTGNKFEFRMVGSSQSISDANMGLNTMLAEVLSNFADRLEGKKDPIAAARRIIRDAYRDHKRIIFNGNNYSKDWEQEAAARGLSNLRTTADAIPRLADEKNVALFTKMGIFTEAEVQSRCEIMLENYCKVLRIEANTMLDMARRDILPVVAEYTAKRKTEADLLMIPAMINDSEKLKSILADLYDRIDCLAIAVEQAPKVSQTSCQAQFYKDSVLTAMKNLREVADAAEKCIPSDKWPFPTYATLLFGV